MMYPTILLTVLSGLSYNVLANPVAATNDCACYTATTFVADPFCPPFKPTRPCIIPECVVRTTSTIPGTNKHCPTTATTTSYLPCQTECQHGCATQTATETASTPCLDHTRPCFTSTTTATPKCTLPSGLVCATPFCVVQSTTVVPAGPVKGCPTTATETKTKTCATTCDGACRTQTVTSTASPW